MIAYQFVGNHNERLLIIFRNNHKMSDVENYSQLLSNYFTDINITNSEYTNNIIGALNRADNFSEFKNNFEQRLIRLKIKFEEINNVNFIKNLYITLANKEWQGAYAEIVAYDCLFDNDMVTADSLLFNVTEDANSTFADKLTGRHNSNFDVLYSSMGRIYADIKCFKDNIKEMLDKIIVRVLKEKGIQMNIIHNFPKDLSYDLIQENIKNIEAELSKKLDINNQIPSYNSEIANLEQLEFQFMWESGVYASVSTFDPYKFAEEYHQQIFNYVDKFHMTHSSFIIFTIFPWFSNNMISNFKQNNEIIYRALARRVFCQYKNLNTKFNVLNSKYQGDETIHDISKQLAGIIFIEDESILSDNPGATNVSSYVYLNPNATIEVVGNYHNNFLQFNSLKMADDFQYDNY